MLKVKMSALSIMCLCILNERRIRERGKTSSTSTMLEISNLWIVFDALEGVKGNKLYRFIHSSVCNFLKFFYRTLQNFLNQTSSRHIKHYTFVYRQ